jgi:predicted phosphoadenosine phosphosulfate sulfurtransferase
MKKVEKILVEYLKFMKKHFKELIINFSGGEDDCDCGCGCDCCCGDSEK